MSETMSPKQVARALGVSESSLKRWCDQGLLVATKTSGGHRRLLLDSVLRFVKETGHALPHPELLDLPALVGGGQRTLRRAQDEFLAALLTGDATGLGQILADLLVAGVSLSQAGDEVLSPAFQRIGEQWASGTTEVYCERRGVEACLRALYDLRRLLPIPAEDAPLAIGATSASDPYSLPTTLVEMVLRQRGWNAQSLGSRLPFATLLRAIDDMRPRLCWLSVSFIDDEQQFLREYTEFFRVARDKVPVVVGGNGLSEPLRRQMEYSAFCDSLRHLEGFAATVWPTAQPGKRNSSNKSIQRRGGHGKNELVREA